ncbi:hypothetical protein [Desulfocurvibacter africanus]|uniref:Portal protein n=1 Tax=Desulfocurvibacter africanus subsp. africanus str. Walvis Bay TaxID=690850 RepID=F3YXK0_DESAF|nr:hypothetical protein [Desulfocurvibacter africanus]EGJ51777.1 hypothetical protein Desaf_3493 [Desulfocurvibacter africanus subsp. africanus str. Walvis Bay]
MPEVRRDTIANNAAATALTGLAGLTELPEPPELAEEERSELLPPEESGKLGYRVFELLAEILADKDAQGLHAKWETFYRLSRNQPWRASKKPGVPLLSANLLHRHRTKVVNTLTNSQPTFNVARAGEIDDKRAGVLDDVHRATQYWWQEQEQQHVFEQSVINGETYGCAIEKVIFDPDLEVGLGEVRTVVVDPFHFGVYPVDCKKLQDAEGVLHFYPMSVRQARRKWPDQAPLIRPDADLLKELGDTRRLIGGEGRDQNVLARIGSFLGSLFGYSGGSSGRGQAGQANDQVLIVEAWVKDFSQIEADALVEARDAAGNIVLGEDNQPLMVPGKISQARYPGFIRRVTACCGGKVVLGDDPNPNINPELLASDMARHTYLYDKFPFSLVPSNTDTSTIWGMGDFEQLEDLQRAFNKCLSQLEYFKDRSVRPKIVNPRDSGVDNAEFSNDLGILNPAGSAVSAGIRYLEFPHIPVDIERLMGVIKDLFFLVSATFDLEQASTPGKQVIAHKAITELLEQVSLSLAGKIRNYHRLVRERGRMFVSHMMNFYTEDRWISFEQNGEQVTKAIRGSEMIAPLKLSVVNGSTLPRSRTVEREEAAELFKAGVIDQAEILRVFDWPSRGEVLKRMQAGPLAALMERLAAAGLPEPVLRIVQGLAGLDDKAFAQAVKAGEVTALVEQAVGAIAAMSEEEQPDPAQVQAQVQADALGRIEVEAKAAQVEQARAETLFKLSQAKTEQARRAVMVAGIGYDEEMIGIRKTELLASLDAEVDRSIAAVTGQSRQAGQASQAGPYSERGLRSNNQTPGIPRMK